MDYSKHAKVRYNSREDSIPMRNEKIPTLTPVADFNAAADVETLRNAFNFPGLESTIINVLTHRSWPQRQDIITTYRTHGTDLVHDVSGAFSSKALKVLLALLVPPNEFLARELEKALSSMRTDDEVISEILCTRSNAKISGIQLAYQELYGKTVMSAVSSDSHLSSDYKELLTSLLGGSRNEVRHTNQEKAAKRAASIHNAVQEGWSTSTKIFIRLLTHESFDQLCCVFDEYRLISGISMQEAIKSTFSGEMSYAALAIVRSAINKSQYYAETLEVALKKFRRDDATLIRIIVSRSEIDLESIKEEYLKIYHKTLYNAIRTEISGTYREAMLGLLNTP